MNVEYRIRDNWYTDPSLINIGESLQVDKKIIFSKKYFSFFLTKTHSKYNTRNPISKIAPPRPNHHTYRDIARPVLLRGAAQVLRSNGTPHDVGQRDDIVAEREEDDRPLGVAKTRRLDPEGEQGEEGGEEAEPGPADHPALGQPLVLGPVVGVRPATGHARRLQLDPDFVNHAVSWLLVWLRMLLVGIEM